MNIINAMHSIAFMNGQSLLTGDIFTTSAAVDDRSSFVYILTR